MDADVGWAEGESTHPQTIRQREWKQVEARYSYSRVGGVGRKQESSYVLHLFVPKARSLSLNESNMVVRLEMRPARLEHLATRAWSSHFHTLLIDRDFKTHTPCVSPNQSDGITF
jgi:hypothetical protein